MSARAAGGTGLAPQGALETLGYTCNIRGGVQWGTGLQPALCLSPAHGCPPGCPREPPSPDPVGCSSCRCETVLVSGPPRCPPCTFSQRWSLPVHRLCRTSTVCPSLGRPGLPSEALSPAQKERVPRASQRGSCGEPHTGRRTVGTWAGVTLQLSEVRDCHVNCRTELTGRRWALAREPVTNTGSAPSALLTSQPHLGCSWGTAGL